MKQVAGDVFREMPGAILAGIHWQGWRCEKCGAMESTFERVALAERKCKNGCDGGEEDGGEQ